LALNDNLLKIHKGQDAREFIIAEGTFAQDQRDNSNFHPVANGPYIFIV